MSKHDERGDFMIDQLKVGEKKSFDEFEASVKERTINKPKKKSIKETVPFSNITYDFSAINGEVYWEERSLEYIFEIIADTPEELEEKKKKFASWVMNMVEVELFDPFISDYHFIATFDDIKEDDEECVEKSTITVIFTAYPYMLANEPKVISVACVANTEQEVAILNKSSHRITPTINADVPASIKLGDVTYGVPIGVTTDDSFKLEAGTNVLTILAEDTGSLIFSFTEEVF